MRIQNLSGFDFSLKEVAPWIELRLSSPDGRNGSESYSYIKKIGLSKSFRTPCVIAVNIWNELFVLIEVNLNPCTSNLSPRPHSVITTQRSQWSASCWIAFRLPLPPEPSPQYCHGKSTSARGVLLAQQGNERAARLWRRVFECGPVTFDNQHCLMKVRGKSGEEKCK